MFRCMKSTEKNNNKKQHTKSRIFFIQHNTDEVCAVIRGRKFFFLYFLKRLQHGRFLCNYGKLCPILFSLKKMLPNIGAK